MNWNNQDFLDRFFSKLKETGIDVSEFELDHIGYQAESNEDYDRLKIELSNMAKFIDENLVGNRRVSLLKLNNPILYRHYIIPALELVAPKKNQICPSALEHAEFVIKEDFESFIKRYPNLKWDTSAIDQPLFPLLKLKLAEDMVVKFHYQPVLEIVRNK